VAKKHEGWEERTHTFDEVWERLNAAGPQQLTTKAGTTFVAKAAITTKGKRRGEGVIRYFQNGQEYGRYYACCWEHYYNCNRTRIGMYSRAVDASIKPVRESRRMTAGELLRTIEEVGGPGKLRIIAKDLRGIDVGLSRISRLQIEVGDEPLWFSRSTGGIKHDRAAALVFVPLVRSGPKHVQGFADPGQVGSSFCIRQGREESAVGPGALSPQSHGLQELR
jgi:hypothetical protein